MSVVSPARINIRIYMGATYPKDWTWLDSDKQPVDLTNWTARMQIRPEVNSDQVLMEILSSGPPEQFLPIGGYVEQDPTNGKYGIYLSDAITEEIDWFDLSPNPVYDYELINPAGDYVRRIMQGTVRASRDVTRPIPVP